VQIISDQVRIFSLLEGASRADFDPKCVHVDVFIAEHNTAFLLFCPEGIAKGAVLCMMENPLLPGEIERDLLPQIMTIQGDPHADALRELAEEKIRALIENKPAAGYFFDAH
jgi:hypothetical protein